MAPSSSNIDDHRKSSMFSTTTTSTTTTTTPISSRSTSGGTGFVIKNQQLLNYSPPKTKENAHHHHHHYVRRLKRLPKLYDYRTSTTTNTNTHNNHSNIIGGGGGGGDGRKAALASVLSAAASILMPNISSDHYHQPHHLHLHQHDVHFHPPSSSSLSSSSSNHSVHDHRASKYLLSKISSLMMLNQSTASSPFLFAGNHTGNYSGVSPILLGSSPGIFPDPIRQQLELELEQERELQLQQQQQEEEMSFWIKIIFYVIYMLICWLGIFGNMIVCYVVARKPSMHTVTNVFIANLALSDILLCLFAVPFTPLYLITFKSWIFGRALCHLVPFAQGVSVYISAFTLMSIAIDRYFVILHPFKPRMQMRTCLWIVATIWISAMILTFPYAHFMKFTSMSIYDYTNSNSNNNSTGDNEDSACDNPDVVLVGPEDNNNNNINPAHNYTISSSNGVDMINLCSEEWPHDEISKMFGITTTILQFVIPFLMITFCYVKICSKLSDRARTIPGNVSARREEQERERTRKTNGMLISMVIIFVISWLPMNMLNLLADFYSEATQWPHHETLFLISHAIAMSSTCYNPFLYAWLNDNFRKEFKEVLPCFGWLNRYFSRVFCRAHDSTTTSCSMAGSANQNNNRSSNINMNNNGNNNHHHQNQNQNHNPHHNENHDNNNNNNAHHFNDDGDAHHAQREDETKLCGFEDGNSTTTTTNNKDNPGQAAASSASAVASSNSSFKRKFMNFRRSSSQQQKKDGTNKSKTISMSSFHHHHNPHPHHHHHQNDNGHKHTTTTDVEEARQSLITKDQIPTRYDGTYMDRGHNNDNNNNNNYRESISIVQNSNTSSSSNSSNATVTTNLHSQLD